ncbi:DUF72 domain-containing protein [Oxalobacteraceae bacterium A2-2]
MKHIRIGCAGWGLNRESAARFPGEGTHLQRYARVLNAAEINSSFYRPHQPQTYQRWADSVPDDFRFSVKLPRAITHDARLAGTDALLERFAADTAGLGHKLGCVLVQLPPSLVLDAAVADAFFDGLQRHFGCMLACEARHASWFDDTATGLLRQHGITRVIADPPAVPGRPPETTPALYARLHGSPRIYYSSYADDYLRLVADRLAEAEGDAWCIFDNTASGAALSNALFLNDIV